jgi:hypothetical protein
VLSADTASRARLRQHKHVLERELPDTLRLSIARQIENNLFAKVGLP